MSLIPERPHPAPVRVSFPEVNLVVVRHEKVTLDGLPSLFDGSFGQLGRAAEAGTITPIGPALAIYLGDPAEVFDLEIGFPVAQALDGPIELGEYRGIPATLDAGVAYVASHIGAFDGLGDAWQNLVGTALDAGATLTGRLVEAYVTEPYPGIDPSRLRTDLILPIAE